MQSLDLLVHQSNHNPIEENVVGKSSRVPDLPARIFDGNLTQTRLIFK